MDLENFKSLLKEKIEFSLTKDQEELTFFLHQFLTSGSSHKVFLLNGYAGTGKTTLIVTHRVTIVKNADAILFLNKTENGFESHCDTFDNLMEIDSFRDMYQAQTEQAYEHLFQSPRA